MGNIEAVRTPDERFEGLSNYHWKPNYIENLPGYEGLRLHYLDEGPSEGRTFLLLHGEPSWSYLYRKMIPVFLEAGHRIVAPDFFGFGRSDKPVADEVYTFNFHRNMLLRFIERLDLQNIVLVIQDWGGLLGLTLPMEEPERYAGMLVMNTGLATGDIPLGDGFEAWREYVATTPDFDVAALMKRSTPILNDDEVAAYAAPFPGPEYKAGVRTFPSIVPAKKDDEGADISRRARNWLHAEWSGKTFMAVGMNDPVLGPAAITYLSRIIAGAGEPMQIAEGGHFVQEWGEEIARESLKTFT